MYLTDKDYEDLQREQKLRKEDEMLKYLRKVNLFKDLRYKQLKALYQQFQYQVRTRGSKLFQQGDKAEYIYVIKNGEVR